MSLKSILAALIVGVSALPALAQTNPGGGGGAGGGPGGPGGPRRTPEEMRAMFEERMKTQLGVTDEEWKALQPRVEKVQQMQRASGRGFGGPGGRRGGGPGGPPDNTPASPVQEKARALQTILDNKDAKPEEIKPALQALRDARAQAKVDLTKAQEQLREVLNARQEAVLVTMGMLE